MNPRRRRRHKRARARVNPRRRRRVSRRSVARYYANPRRRRRSRAKGYFANPRRRRRHSYRRNPPAVSGLMTNLGYAGLGFVGTKFAVGSVLPAIGISASPASMTSIVAKGAVAYVVAWAGENFLGSHTFMPLFLGGAATAIQDIVSLYLAPSFPGLAADQLHAYYRAPLMAPRGRTALPSPHVGSYYGELSAEDMI